MLGVRIRPRVVALRTQIEPGAEAAAVALAVRNVSLARVAFGPRCVLGQIAAEVAGLELAPFGAAKRTRQWLGPRCVVLAVLPKAFDVDGVAASESAPDEGFARRGRSGRLLVPIVEGIATDGARVIRVENFTIDFLFSSSILRR